MALPGMRGFGERGASGLGGRRNNGFQTSNGSYGVNSALNGKPRSAAALHDPSAARRLDGLEQRLNGHEQANRGLMEQIMKLTQETRMEMKKKDSMLMEEKNARMRAEQSLQGCVDKLADTEDRLRRTEESSRENKNALAQLISHTKNVERAVTMSQQDIVAKKEAQAAKLQDLNHKLATMTTNRENLERMCYTMRDEISELNNKCDNQSLELKDLQGLLRMQNKMFDAQTAKLKQGREESETGKKMSETQKAALETKIIQLQNVIMDVQSKLNHERKEREVDLNSMSTRISECNAEIADGRRKRDADLKELQVATKELATMSDAEKQRIIVQISAVQTDLKRTIDERDLKLKQNTVHRLEEIEQEVKFESKQRLENEKEMRMVMETSNNKMKMYTDECTEAARQMLSAECETLRTRIQELSEFSNDLELQIAELRSECGEMQSKSTSAAEGREKVLEAKIEDLGDRLRLGMGKLQSAIGETSANGRGGGGTVSLEEVEKLHEADVEGIREKMTVQINALDEQITNLKAQLKNQQDLIENKLRTHQQAGEEASTILGDKLQQKLDSVSFTQERMKRQLDDLQDKTQGAPTEIFDMRERMQDVEREVSMSGKDRKVAGERLDNLEKDMDHIMGRGETSDVSGIPTINRLLTDIDDANANTTKLADGLEQFKTQITEKLEEESRTRESDIEKVHKDHVRQEKRTKALKERMKKMSAAPVNQALAGPDEDEVFEDEEEENE